MTWAQARALREGGFEVGAHTVNHPILSRLEPAQAEQEMVDSRAAIRREVGVCSEVFCYPNGKAGDYTPAIMALSARHFQAASRPIAGRCARQRTLPAAADRRRERHDAP